MLVLEDIYIAITEGCLWVQKFFPIGIYNFLYSIAELILDAILFRLPPLWVGPTRSWAGGYRIFWWAENLLHSAVLVLQASQAILVAVVGWGIELWVICEFVGAGESGLNRVEICFCADVLIAMPLFQLFLLIVHDFAQEIVVGIMLELPYVRHQGRNVYCVLAWHDRDSSGDLWPQRIVLWFIWHYFCSPYKPSHPPHTQAPMPIKIITNPPSEAATSSPLISGSSPRLQASSCSPYLFLILPFFFFRSTLPQIAGSWYR